MDQTLSIIHLIIIGDWCAPLELQIRMHGVRKQYAFTWWRSMVRMQRICKTAFWRTRLGPIAVNNLGEVDNIGSRFLIVGMVCLAVQLIAFLRSMEIDFTEPQEDYHKALHLLRMIASAGMGKVRLWCHTAPFAWFIDACCSKGSATWFGAITEDADSFKISHLIWKRVLFVYHYRS